MTEKRAKRKCRKEIKKERNGWPGNGKRELDEIKKEIEGKDIGGCKENKEKENERVNVYAEKDEKKEYG